MPSVWQLDQQRIHAENTTGIPACRLRIEQWVDNNGYSRQGSKVLQDEQDSPSAVKQKGSLGRKPSLVRLGSLERRQSNSSLGEEPSVYVSVSMQPKLNKAMSDKGFQEATATIERAMSSASSDSQSASGNELQDTASDASGVDEELLVDWRWGGHVVPGTCHRRSSSSRLLCTVCAWFAPSVQVQ